MVPESSKTNADIESTVWYVVIHVIRFLLKNKIK